jgi:formamidopyrimidine-DNA glycosylase
MPEGPEVKITSDGIRTEILNFELIGLEINEASRYYKDFKSGSFKNINNLNFPILITDVFSKGKKILITGVDNNANEIAFISALAMEGSWKLYPGKHSGIELYFRNNNEYKILYFHDTRHFGSFDICISQEDIDFVMKYVGPDLLNDYISFEHYNGVISLEKIKNKEICWFMMEQRFFSGVGNYLLAEILYASKILPTRMLKDLSDTDKYNLWFFSRKLLKESYESGGLTIATYFSMSGEKGIFDTKIYMKEKDPQGNPVLTGTFSNKRTSHYVPAVQV